MKLSFAKPQKVANQESEDPGAVPSFAKPQQVVIHQIELPEAKLSFAKPQTLGGVDGKLGALRAGEKGAGDSIPPTASPQVSWRCLCLLKYSGANVLLEWKKMVRLTASAEKKSEEGRRGGRGGRETGEGERE